MKPLHVLESLSRTKIFCYYSDLHLCSYCVDTYIKKHSQHSYHIPTVCCNPSFAMACFIAASSLNKNYISSFIKFSFDFHSMYATIAQLQITNYIIKLSKLHVISFILLFTFTMQKSTFFIVHRYDYVG